MRIQLTEEFYSKVVDHYENAQNHFVQTTRGCHSSIPFETWDGKAVVTYSEEGDEYDEKEKKLTFKATNNCLDPIDIPLSATTTIGSDLYFNTDTFQVETNWNDEPVSKEPPEPIEDVVKPLTIDSIVNEIYEDEEVHHIDSVEYLDEDTKERLTTLINSLLQEKYEKEREEQYQKASLFGKIGITVARMSSDISKARTSFEADALERLGIAAIVTELFEHGLAKTILDLTKEEFKGDGSKSYQQNIESMAISRFTEKLRQEQAI